MIYIISLMLGLIAIFGEIIMIFAWVVAYIQFKNGKISKYKPPVTVIVPCKGVAEKFKENILAICNQNYRNYNIIFVTDSKKDPTYKILQKIASKKLNVKIVVSDFIEDSSGKISALIKGVKTAGKTEVLVFADSDIKPHKKWLSYLISPLSDEKIGATTGFRWYFPRSKSSLLLSAWNMNGMIGFFYSFSNITWGGSTAIRKDLFEKLDIGGKWKKGFSDDLILTIAVKAAKYKIKFVPECTVESPPEGDIKFIVKWGIRQLTWVKWYYPYSSLVSTSGFLFLKFMTILGFFLILFGYILPGLLMISTLLIEVFIGLVSFSTMKKIMAYPKSRFKYPFYYGLLTPIVFFLIAYNLFRALFKREIHWGGRVYKKSDVIL